MLTRVLFLSLAEALELEPDASTVAISILDRSEAADRPTTLHEFKDHLVLEFEDVPEEVLQPNPEAFWPDQLTEAQHALFAQGRGERVPELADASRIVAFVRKHHFGPAPVTLVVHCHGGISRSAAVAEWVGAVHWVPLPQLGSADRSTDRANRRVLRLLDKAAGRV